MDTSNRRIMMKQKWIMGIAILGTIFVFMMTYRYLNSTTSGAFPNAYEDEKIVIDNFYDKEEMVIEGESFDLRCLYYDDKDIENSFWQIVKKTDSDIDLQRIEIGNQNGDKFIDLCNKKFGDFYEYGGFVGYFGHDKDFVYVYNFLDDISQYTGRTNFLNDHERKNREDLIVKVYYNDISEEFNLSINTNDHYAILKRMNEARENGLYDQNPQLKKLSYLYYASLYRADFDAWYQEMDTMLNNGGFPDALFFADEKMVNRAFHLSDYIDGDISEDQLRAILDLNDEQYKKYKELVKKACEKGVFNDALSFLVDYECPTGTTFEDYMNDMVEQNQYEGVEQILTVLEFEDAEIGLSMVKTSEDESDLFLSSRLFEMKGTSSNVFHGKHYPVRVTKVSEVKGENEDEEVEGSTKAYWEEVINGQSEDFVAGSTKNYDYYFGLLDGAANDITYNGKPVRSETLSFRYGDENVQVTLWVLAQEHDLGFDSAGLVYGDRPDAHVIF